MSTSTDSPSTTLPSIHEMFPDHLLAKPEYESSRPRSHRGHSYPHSPSVHHAANHRDRAQEPHCTCTHTGCPRHAHDSRTVSQSQGDCPSLSSSKRRPSSSSTSPSQNIYAFNVLRSCPSSANKQIDSPAFRVDILPSPASSSGRDDYADCRQYQDRRDGVPYASSSDGYTSHSAPSLQRTRASVEGDPRTAINSFPLSHSGLPLPPSPPKHHQYPPRCSSASGAGTLRGAADGYSAHGTFHINEGLGNDEEDDGNSGAEENNTTNGKKHICPTCLKRFNRPSSLRIHVNTHTGATPFRCPWPNCGREFNVNSNMRRHYRNHATPGFSRSQNATSNNNNNPAPSANGLPTTTTSSPTTSHTIPLTDGRRKRRRVNIPPSQIPPPSPSGNAHGAMVPSSHPQLSHQYPSAHASHRSEFEYRHSHPHGGHPPHFSSSASSSSSQPQPSYPARSGAHAYPQGLHPGSNLTHMQAQMQYHQHHMPSPPISNLSISEEDEYSSGSESDASAARYRSRSRAQGRVNVNMNRKTMDDKDDEMLEYDEREHLSRSLARVAVEHSPSAHKAHAAYSPYPTYHERDYRPRYSSSEHHDRDRDAPYDSYTGRNEAHHHSSTRASTNGPLTPGSSFHSSSPSPSPPPGTKYSASTAYHRSLADVRVSTTLRPAFAGSNERERV